MIRRSGNHCFDIFYVDGEKRYHHFGRSGLKVGDTILSGETAEYKPGNYVTR